MMRCAMSSAIVGVGEIVDQHRELVTAEASGRVGLPKLAR